MSRVVEVPASGAVGRVRRWLRRRSGYRELQRHPAYARYAGHSFEVLLHFPDLPVNLYQARQWYGPLERLARDHSVAILCYEPTTAEIIRSETSLPVVVVRGAGEMTRIRDVIQPKVILYPNQNYTNFGLLGLNTCQHVFISHGESDKIYMSANWVKIFNYYFVAGEAARNRLRQRLFNYDVDSRTIMIGRPQIDIDHPAPALPKDDRILVLYAPTWEGGRTSMRYGSVASHGVALAQALLADDRFRLIYRPHPRTGVVLTEHASANQKIMQLVADANTADPDADHLVDTTPFGWQLQKADVMITDISAVAYDWLTTAKPLLMTLPAERAAVVDQTTFVADMNLLPAEQAFDVPAILSRLIKDASSAEKMSHWCHYYYGDTSPGASMERFVAAVQRLIDERDTWMSGHPLEEELSDSLAPIMPVRAMLSGLEEPQMSSEE